MDKLIDSIQDRYLLFINDLVPFLIDNIHNRNEKVKMPIKSIINKFEEMSGSKIENYLRWSLCSFVTFYIKYALGRSLEI